MNPLLAMTQLSSQRQNPLGNLQQLDDFMKKTTPAEAQAKIDEALSNGSMTPQQFQQLKTQAQNMANMLGLK